MLLNFRKCVIIVIYHRVRESVTLSSVTMFKSRLFRYPPSLPPSLPLSLSSLSLSLPRVLLTPVPLSPRAHHRSQAEETRDIPQSGNIIQTRRSCCFVEPLSPLNRFLPSGKLFFISLGRRDAVGKQSGRTVNPLTEHKHQRREPEKRETSISTVRRF